MMSWQPRMMREEAVELGPARLGQRVVAARGQDVEGERHLERDRRLPERIEGWIVVVLLAGIARHHHAAKAHRLDAFEILDALLDRAHRRLAEPDQAVRRMGAVGLEPAVVGVEAGLLVVEVGMVADQHADGGIDDLGRHAVLVLVGQPRRGIPAAAVQILEFRAADADVLGRHAGRGDQAHRHRRLHAVDEIDVAHAFLVDDMRRPLAPRRIDVVDVAVGRLGDVRIGGYRTPVHAISPAWVGEMVGRAQAPRQGTAERPFRRAAAVEPPARLWHIRAACGFRPVTHAAVAQW